MKIFDAHSDIFSDVVQRTQSGDKEIIKKYHLNKLREGNICGAIFVIWTESEYADNYRKRTLEIMKCAAKELVENPEVQLVRKYDDIAEAEKNGKFFIIQGLEGLAFIGEDLDLVYLLHQLGIRHAGLTWNEENLLAAGVSRNPDRGLTVIGKQAVKTIEKAGILLDVSHLNERSFWDCAAIATKPFIASHSNAYRLCPHRRNLKDEQIKAIADIGGVIGMNAWTEFVALENPDLNKLVDHIDYITDLAGIDHVGLGFDFLEFLQDETLPSFSDGSPTELKGLENASKAQNLIKILEEKKYPQADIEKIAYKNFLRVLQNII